MNSREEFHINIFDILCTNAEAKNFAEGPGHTGNDVTYTRSHIGSLILFECMTNSDPDHPKGTHPECHHNRFQE